MQYSELFILNHNNSLVWYSKTSSGREFLGGLEFLGEFKNQVERVMATLKNGLVMIKNYEILEWHKASDSSQLAFNCTVHKTTGVAPLTLLTRRRSCVPPELLNQINFENKSVDIEAIDRHIQNRMIEAAERNKIRFEKGRAKIKRFLKGDFVLIKNNPRNKTSLDQKFSEPYEIQKILENDGYLVKKVIGHRGRLRKVAHDQLRKATQAKCSQSNQSLVSPSNTQEDGLSVTAQQRRSSRDVELPDGQQAGPSGINQNQHFEIPDDDSSST